MLKILPKSLFKFSVAAITLLLVVFNLLGYFQQKAHFEQLLQDKTASTLREFIPVLNERSKPVAQLRQCVFSTLNMLGQDRGKNIRILNSQVDNHLRSNSMIMLLDSNYQTYFAKNIREDQKNDIHRATELFSIRRFRNLTVSERHESEYLSNKLFENSIKIHHIPNFQNAMPLKFMGRKGILFIGLKFKGNPAKSHSQIASRLLEPQKEVRNIQGSYFIFVPESTYLDQNWYQKTIAKKSQALAIPEMVGTAAKIKKSLMKFGQNQAAKAFEKLSKESSSGSFIVGKYGYCFAEVPGFSKFRNRFYVLHQRRIPDLPVLITEKAAISILITGIFFFFILIFKISERNNSFNFAIEKQFLAITAFSLVFPISGMLFQEATRASLENFVQQTQIFSELETRFLQAENGIEERLSDIFNCMYLYQEIYNELGEGNQEKFVKALRSIRDRRIYNTIVCKPGGNIRVTDTGKADDRNVEKNLKTALLALAKFSIENLNLPNFLPRNKNSGMIESLAFDSLSEGFDRTKLYQNSINQMQLQPFNLGQHSVWILNNIEYNRNYDAQKLFFLVIDRNRIIRELLDDFQQQQKQTPPELVFYINIGPYSSIAPTWGEGKPELASILEAAAQENEELRHRIPFADGELFLRGRRLKELEWVVLALHYQPSSAESSSIISRSVVVATAYIAIILLVLTFYFRHFFTRPIDLMRNAVTKIASGDFKNKLPPRQPDELGRLFSSFNAMAEELEEKEYLSRFLSNLAKEAISDKRSVNATKINATILFSDIRSFTTLTEQNSAEEIVEMLNDYMTQMETVIEKHSGSIEKFIGDAIMAVFLPELGKAHPSQRAAEAALEMIDALHYFNQQRIQSKKFTVANGFGIATGELLMGSMGNLQGQQRYTVTGAVVNVAAEMEKLSKQARQIPIVLCPATAQRVKMPRYQLAGMADSNKAFELLSAR